MKKELLVKYLKAKELKIIFIKYQKFEEAAKIRDVERNLAFDFYKKLTSEDIKWESWNIYESAIDKYCIEEYGFCIENIVDSDSIKSIIRQIKLKNIGI